MPMMILARSEVEERRYNTITRGMEPKRLNERTLAYTACRSYIVRMKVQDTAELVVKVVNAEVRKCRHDRDKEMFNEQNKVFSVAKTGSGCQVLFFK
jgi:hypothetical protein